MYNTTDGALGASVTLGANINIEQRGKTSAAWLLIELIIARARGARAERGGPPYDFLKLYGDFSNLFMVKNGSETPRHGEPWELGDG
jgi:hypothetical protein